MHKHTFGLCPLNTHGVVERGHAVAPGAARTQLQEPSIRVIKHADTRRLHNIEERESWRGTSSAR